MLGRSAPPLDGHAWTAAPGVLVLTRLGVYAGEGAVVEVATDVAPRVGAAAGTLLVPVPGVLPHEIIEIPSSWMERHAERRSASTPGFAAVT